jgi:hypothetical protein
MMMMMMMMMMRMMRMMQLQKKKKRCADTMYSYSLSTNQGEVRWENVIAT